VNLNFQDVLSTLLFLCFFFTSSVDYSVKWRNTSSVSLQHEIVFCGRTTADSGLLIISLKSTLGRIQCSLSEAILTDERRDICRSILGVSVD
jgi:hypothetical protein